MEVLRAGVRVGVWVGGGRVEALGGGGRVEALRGGGRVEALRGGGRVVGVRMGGRVALVEALVGGWVGVAGAVGRVMLAPGPEGSAVVASVANEGGIPSCP